MFINIYVSFGQTGYILIFLMTETSVCTVHSTVGMSRDTFVRMTLFDTKCFIRNSSYSLTINSTVRLLAHFVLLTCHVPHFCGLCLHIISAKFFRRYDGRVTENDAVKHTNIYRCMPFLRIWPFVRVCVQKM